MSVSEKNTNATAALSFGPSEITRSTFCQLLSCYATTAREIYKSKRVAKSRSNRAPKQLLRGPAPTVGNEAQPHEEKLNKDVEVEAFLQLDEWRYEKLPALIKERSTGDSCAKGLKQSKVAKKEGTGAYLGKDELVKLMDWKLKHGVHRSMLLGMIKANDESLVEQTTAAAFASIPNSVSISSADDAFPKTSLETLTGPLRGVGPATASLILSVAAGDAGANNQVTFFSDELYLWLCRKDYPSTGKTDTPADGGSKKSQSKTRRPNGDLNLKYNIREYKELWDAVLGFQSRLNEEAHLDGTKEEDKRIFSVLDIEKVAYVLGHINFSGFFDDKLAAVVAQPAQSDSLLMKSDLSVTKEEDNVDNTQGLQQGLVEDNVEDRQRDEPFTISGPAKRKRKTRQTSSVKKKVAKR
ncbi:hypothetical protein V8E54_001127 [Elaphomyces granulatus]